jgi:hypothetical protein
MKRTPRKKRNVIYFVVFLLLKIVKYKKILYLQDICRNSDYMLVPKLLRKFSLFFTLVSALCWSIYKTSTTEKEKFVGLNYAFGICVNETIYDLIVKAKQLENGLAFQILRRSSPFLEKGREKRKETQLKLESRIREVLSNLASSTPSFPLVGMKVGRTRGTLSGFGCRKEGKSNPSLHFPSILCSCASRNVCKIRSVSFANLLAGIGRVIVISELRTTFYSVPKTPINTVTFVECSSYLYVRHGK